MTGCFLDGKEYAEVTLYHLKASIDYRYKTSGAVGSGARALTRNVTDDGESVVARVRADLANFIQKVKPLHGKREELLNAYDAKVQDLILANPEFFHEKELSELTQARLEYERIRQSMHVAKGALVGAAVVVSTLALYRYLK